MAAQPCWQQLINDWYDGGWTPHRTRTSSGRSVAAAATSASRRAFQFRLHPLPEFTGGMLMLPATADVIARSSPRGGRSRRALDYRQCHALPADALRAGGRARQARRVRAHGLRRAAEAAERALAPFRALATPVVDMVHPMPYPRSTRPRTTRLPPARRRPDDVHRPRRHGRGGDDPRAPRGVGRGDARRPAARARRGDGARACGRHRVRPSRFEILVNVATFYTGPTTASDARRGSRASRRPCTRTTTAPTSTSSPTRARNGSVRPTRVRRGTGLRRSRAATTRTTCSGSTRTSRPRADAGRSQPSILRWRCKLLGHPARSAETASGAHHSSPHLGAHPRRPRCST